MCAKFIVDNNQLPQYNANMRSQEKILLWGSNIWIFADGMFGPLFALFTERIGGNVFDISWAWATYLVVTGVMAIVFGIISDRTSKEYMMITGYALTALFTFCYLFVSSSLHLLLVQAGLGIALALCNPTWFALYDKYSTSASAGSDWGLSDGIGKILMGIAILVGGWIVTEFSFDALFITMGVVQVIATIYMTQLLHKKTS